MPLRAVLFDLDDTLCDTLGCRPERMRKALEHVCSSHVELELHTLLALALEPLEEPRAVRHLAAALEAHGLAGTPAFDEAHRIYELHFEPLRLFSAVLETLNTLRGRYTLGLISNADAWHQEEKLAALGLAAYFSCTVLSGTFGCEKPDPRIFHHALAQVGARPDESAFVGDRLDIDIAGAQAAGMRAIWFNHWGGTCSPQDTQPDAVIRNLAQLPSALDRL